MMRAMSRTLSYVALAFALGCKEKPPEPSRPEPPAVRKSAASATSAEKPAQTAVGTEAARLPAVERLVAIGDLHGDLAATRAVLRLAGAIDAGDAWVGGRLVVVQTGDQVDRGDEDREVLDLLARVREDAAQQGGALHLLSGNHETMNVAGDFRYVTQRSFESFEGSDSRNLPEPIRAA